MCYLCDEPDELFEYACCEECGEPICYDAPPEGVPGTIEGTFKAMANGEVATIVRQAKKYKAGHFCVTCHNSFTAEVN